MQVTRELYQEYQQIRQDADLTVANQGKGFFGRTDQIDPALLESLLPTFDELLGCDSNEPVMIELDSQIEENPFNKLSCSDKYTLLKSFMDTKQLQVKLRNLKFPIGSDGNLEIL